MTTRTEYALSFGENLLELRNCDDLDTRLKAAMPGAGEMDRRQVCLQACIVFTNVEYLARSLNREWDGEWIDAIDCLRERLLTDPYTPVTPEECWAVIDKHMIKTA